MTGIALLAAFVIQASPACHHAPTGPSPDQIAGIVKDANAIVHTSRRQSLEHSHDIARSMMRERVLSLNEFHRELEREFYEMRALLQAAESNGHPPESAPGRIDRALVFATHHSQINGLRLTASKLRQQLYIPTAISSALDHLLDAFDAGATAISRTQATAEHTPKPPGSARTSLNDTYNQWVVYAEQYSKGINEEPRRYLLGVSSGSSPEQF